MKILRATGNAAAARRHPPPPPPSAPPSSLPPVCIVCQDLSVCAFTPCVGRPTAPFPTRILSPTTALLKSTTSSRGCHRTCRQTHQPSPSAPSPPTRPGHSAGGGGPRTAATDAIAWAEIKKRRTSWFFMAGGDRRDAGWRTRGTHPSVRVCAADQLHEVRRNIS